MQGMRDLKLGAFVILDWRSPELIWYCAVLAEGFHALARGGRTME
jgi:hypothetical protein